MNFEKCIVCGKDTGILADTPIYNRKYYVVGSGQLCSDCYNALYADQKPNGVGEKT